MPGDDRFALAVAQVGGIARSDSRAAVVNRLIDMMRESRSRGASFVVFPELTLTTFFPRYWIESEAELDEYFETQMPNGHVEPLFDCAKQLEIGFYLGYAELTPEGRRYNTAILVDARRSDSWQVPQDPSTRTRNSTTGRPHPTPGEEVLRGR